MKQILTFLTLTAVSFVVSPQRTDAQQYAWVPVVANEPAATTSESPTAYSTSIGESYATYVGDDLVPPPDDFGGGDDWDSCCSQGKGKGKGGCDCPACRTFSPFAGRVFGGVEYLQWYNKGRSLPPLVTGNPQAANGVLPGATLLFGGGRVGDDLKAGGRLTGGLWLDDCENSAVVIRAFASEGDSTPFAAASPGDPLLAVPFFDTDAPTPGNSSVEIAELIGALAVPGQVGVQTSNEVFGGDVYGRTLLDSGCNYRLDLLGGYQYSRINDSVLLQTNSPGAGPVPPFASFDYYNAKNDFNAGELGLLGELYRGRVTVEAMGKLGLGNMRQSVIVNGGRTIPAALPGGIFSNPANIGLYKRNVFAISPEASVKLRYCLRENISLTVGYTFLYWSRVALSGDQINTRVSGNAIFGGPAAPPNAPFRFVDTDFWVQTVDIGLALRY